MHDASLDINLDRVTSGKEISRFSKNPSRTGEVLTEVFEYSKWILSINHSGSSFLSANV